MTHNRKTNPPAYPRPFSWDESPVEGMTSGDRIEPHEAQEGATLRDYFVRSTWGTAYGIYRKLLEGGKEIDLKDTARMAWNMADALLATRDEPKP